MATGYTNSTKNKKIKEDIKALHDIATTTKDGLMSAGDKKKLDGIATNANNYSHPTTSGNKHIPSGGSSGQILRWSADGTAAWGADNNTTYSVATTSANGLMSSSDKKKLDGVANNANNYSHPTTSGNKHVPSGGSSGQVLKWSADGTAAWVAQSSLSVGSATKATQDAIGNVIGDTYTKRSIYNDTTVNVGRKSGSTIGAYSFAFGDGAVASGDNSFAFGNDAVASNTCAFAFGNDAVASAVYSFAQGCDIVSSGYAAHAEGEETTADGEASHAEGRETKALAEAAHAEGYKTEARYHSHAEGESTIAYGFYSHAEGYKTEATGEASHAEGKVTVASGDYSHAEGVSTEAKGGWSHAGGLGTIAQDIQYAIGAWNKESTANASGKTSGTAFVVGNGVNYSRSNALRVTGEGNLYMAGSSNSNGADYAEFEEWADGNIYDEDRVGYFVTYDENSTKKIRKANAGEWILGIVSGHPCVIGNSDEDWGGRYILDDFGRKIKEIHECEEIEVDPESGEETTVTKTVIGWKENPDYDSTKTYIPRQERKEWAAVGWVGVLHVRDDGTCKANGFCKCADGGIATSATVEDYGYLTPIYRVIDRVTDNIIRVVLNV